MKIEFDPSNPKQVESVLKMLKGDCPDLWIKINYIPISQPLWEVFKFDLATKLFLKRNGLNSLEDLACITRKKAVSLEKLEQRGEIIVENIELTLGGSPWKKKKGK